MRKKVRLNQVNRLHVSRGRDGKWRVRTPTSPPTVLFEAPSHKKAYDWAHANRTYSKKTPRWTEDELDYLASNYGRLPATTVAEHLGRSTNALKIAAIRKRNGLNQRLNIYTARAAAEVMGVG